MGSAVPLPNGQTVYLDDLGVPLANGLVYHWVPGTSNVPKVTWQDPLEQAANTNPINLDGAGRATIFGDGQYRQILKDQFGNTIWDKVTVALGSTAFAAAIPTLVGDTGSGGVAGQVPAPPAGSAAQKLYLGADGSWDSLAVVVPTTPPANQAGFLFVPQREMTTTADALKLTDAGGNISYVNASAGVLTISSDSAVNWIPDVVTQVLIYNNAASGILTLTQDAGVFLLWPGNSSGPANRALAPNGQCLLSRLGAQTWTVVGAGLS